MYDTGSPKIVTSSADCLTGCPYRLYKPSLSSTYEYVSAADPIHYGKGEVNGFIGRDTVCLSDGSDQCAPAFDFYIVTSAGEGIFTAAEDINGILGMSPYMTE